MGLPNIAEYYGINRKPSVIKLQDRDVMCFHTDWLNSDVYYSSDSTNTYSGNQMVKLCDELDPTIIRYQFTAQDMRPLTNPSTPQNPNGVTTTNSSPIQNTFALQYMRVSGSGDPVNTVLNGKYLAFFKDSLDNNTNKIFPFLEVHQPTINYNSDANLLTMFFWTSFTSVWVNNNGYTYPNPATDNNPPQLYIQFDPIKQQWAEEVDDGVVRVLCMATGSIQKFIVRGGGIVDSSASSSDVLDFVPLFEYPQVIQSYEYWNDFPPYPSDPNIVTFQQMGDTSPLNALYEGMPLVLKRGHSTGLNTNGTALLLANPLDLDINTSGNYDGFPYFYIFENYTTAPGGSSPPKGYAYYPSGQFDALIDTTINNGGSVKVGEPCGILMPNINRSSGSSLGGSDAFVRGVYGARVISIGSFYHAGQYDEDDDYKQVTLVRDHVPCLVVAPTGPTGPTGAQTEDVYVVHSNQSLATGPTGQDLIVDAPPST